MTKTLTRYLALGCLLTAPATYGADYVIGGLETTTLTRIVPDKIIFPFTNGLGSLGNWEPYAGVLGTSTFLIAANTFVDGTTDLQRYGVAFQPAAGGPNVEGHVFFADDGTPFTSQVNASRQDGNPARVAGDSRRGATNFITGAEASPHVYVTGPHSFGSDNRWNLGFGRDADRRYGTVQTFSLDPATLAQTMLSKAQDSAYGRDTTGDGSGNDQYTRFGGELVALDNGNFVSVVEDRSLNLAAGRTATATIFKPDGTIVKERFVAAEGEQWSNVAPFLGGFCVRTAGILHFFDNDGTEIGTGVDQDTAVDDFDGSVLFTDRGRGDDSRIAGHINSPYVFMAQKRGTDVYLAAWDSRLVATASGFVAEINVNELEPALGGTDTSTFTPTAVARVNLAVDALNRVAVASEVTLTDPNPVYNTQVAMRVLKLDDSVSPKKFNYLTHSFLTFVNASTNENNTARSLTPAVAMTTKQICIAAKGLVNSANNPNAAADSPNESNFYTVISHPDPKEDPTKWAVRVQNPEADGLAPRHGTVYVNANSPFNYGNPGFTEPFVDITANFNAAVCFGDSTSPNTDFNSMNAVWTLYDGVGNNLIAPTVITNLTGAGGPTSLTNNWLAFFRSDGSCTPGNAVATPRVRASRLGNGFMFGGRGDRLGLEIPALLAINTDASSGGNPLTTTSGSSGFPVVQLINNDGTPGAGILTGMNEAEAEPSGNVFCHGMEVLANGNIVIAMESRQDQELVDRFGGTTPNRHVVYKVVTPAGVVVKPLTLVSETFDRTELFGFGIGVTSNGFAIRFSYRPRHDGSGKTSGTIRLFDNNGNPVGGDINMSDAVGAFLGTGPNNPTGGNGGRGDSVGFGGNYKDAYVNACIGDQEGVRGPVFVTVYNADGSVRYHRPVAEAGETNRASTVSAAIHPDGRVFVAMDDQISSADGVSRLIVGKMFDPAGNSMGPLFYVSELETATLATGDTQSPRVAWRDNVIACVWRSLNGPTTATNVVGFRMFNDVATTPIQLSLTHSGGNAVISWPTTATGFTLRSTGNLSSGTWQTNSPAPVINGNVFTVTEPIGPNNKFYQLIK